MLKRYDNRRKHNWAGVTTIFAFLSGCQVSFKYDLSSNSSNVFNTTFFNWLALENILLSSIIYKLVKYMCMQILKYLINIVSLSENIM